jgi:hypothetical protein
MFGKNQKQENFCPLLNKTCIEHECMWFTQVRGNDPQTGKDIDEWSCAVSWIPMLLIENSKQGRSTAAAVESFRNESCKRSDIMNNIIAGAQRQMLQQQDIDILPSQET